MKIHIIMHESFESPAAVAEWAGRNDHSLSYSRLFQGDDLPYSCENIDFLVVMGGPQSPATTKEECHYFDAKQEIALIKKAIDADKRVLGVCLGAQLIGEALGARFEHSPNREIGVFDIMLTPDAKEDSILLKWPDRLMVGHWHGDMPGLTKDTKILAYSKGCPRQIVKYSDKVYGFQCHLEFTKAAVAGMIKNCGHELVNGKPYIQKREELINFDYDEMNQYLFQFLDDFTSQG
ncbi:MAG: C26 family cysteine hydrolase domain-containing family [Nanoarchaeota archaeon]|nr:C26 family cysteine hydrolase domain-containing family [Nanoarchaeota archaeon]